MVDLSLLPTFAPASYGLYEYFSKPGGRSYVLPLVSAFDPSSDSALTVALPPDGNIPHLQVEWVAARTLRLTLAHRGMGGGKPSRLRILFDAHPADYRSALAAYAARYPRYFEAPLPRGNFGGSFYYHHIQNHPDFAEMDRQNVRFIWSSFWFTHLGEFLPAEQEWYPFTYAKLFNLHETMTDRRINGFITEMHCRRIGVFAYFNVNVTEFGKNMQDPAIPATRADDPALWRDPVAFLKLRLSEAYLKPPILTCYNAWVTDVGDPAYRQFMLDQAQRHIALLPDTDGICINRNDWLCLDNPGDDDGVSWVDGKPARSLYRSWIAFMDELGPLMHSADKVIFANTMTMRLELTRQLDGIYNEFGNNPGALNASALMGIRKPVLGWTTNETLHQPDPDTFFQRHLYLGVYPTAPYPFNHHCITPEPAADGFYMDYGPLLDAMRGKRWMLTAQCVNADTPGLGVNLFEVPGGYALPVTFGGKAASARVRLRNCPGLDRVKCEALYPGAAAAVPVPATFEDDVLELQVPLKRGCALVRLTKSP